MLPTKPIIRRRKRQARAVWDGHKETIRRLYLDEGETLPHVVEIMRTHYNFDAKLHEYKTRLTKWGFNVKNINDAVACAIVRKNIERADKGTIFIHRGQTWDPVRAKRHLARKDQTEVEALEDSADTPSDLVCRTPTPSNAGINIVGSPIGSPTASHHSFHGSPILIASGAGRTSTPRSVPRPLTDPREMRIPELLLRRYHEWLSGTFDAGVWEYEDENDYVRRADGMNDGSGSLTLLVDKFLSAMAAAPRSLHLSWARIRDGFLHVDKIIKRPPIDLFPRLIVLKYRMKRPEFQEFYKCMLLHCANMAAATYRDTRHPLTEIFRLLHSAMQIHGDDICLKFFSSNSDFLHTQLGDGHITVAYNRTLDVQVKLELLEASAVDLECAKLIQSHEERCGSGSLQVAEVLRVQTQAFELQRQWAKMRQTGLRMLELGQTLDLVFITLNGHVVCAQADWGSGDRARSEEHREQALLLAIQAWGTDAPLTQYHYENFILHTDNIDKVKYYRRLMGDRIGWDGDVFTDDA